MRVPLNSAQPISSVPHIPAVKAQEARVPFSPFMTTHILEPTHLSMSSAAWLAHSPDALGRGRLRYRGGGAEKWRGQPCLRLHGTPSESLHGVGKSARGTRVFRCCLLSGCCVLPLCFSSKTHRGVRMLDVQRLWGVRAIGGQAITCFRVSVSTND